MAKSSKKSGGLGLDAQGGEFLAVGEGLADINSRLSIADSLLKLCTRQLLFKDFMREVLLIAMGVIKADAGSILEVNYTTQQLFFRTAVGQSADSIMSFTIPIGQGISGFVAESKQPFRADQMDYNPVHLKAIAKVAGLEVRNIIAAPIVIRGKTYGVVELINHVGDSGFSQKDLDLLVYFSEMASHAIEIRFMVAWSNRGDAGQNGNAA